MIGHTDGWSFKSKKILFILQKQDDKNMEEQRLDLTLFSEKIEKLRHEIAQVIVGQEQAVDLVLTCILANGHVLIEGVPGVAKTLLALWKSMIPFFRR